MRLLTLFSIYLGIFSSNKLTRSSSKRNIDRSIEGKLFKGNRNAIFHIQKGEKHLIPDFYTFSKMGFNLSTIEKVSDDFLSNIPLGDPIKPIPVFRPEDYMYHKECEYPEQMVHSCHCFFIFSVQ
jgi:hypothetical protein